MHSCFPPDQLQDFLDNRLVGDSPGQIEQHLEECTECLAAFDQLLTLRELACFAVTATESVTQQVKQPRTDRQGHLPAIAGFELFECLGRGGHGVVYRARDLSLDREIALKVLKAGELASFRDREQLFLEARAAARLHHPHIVQIYSIGDYQGLPFYVMQCQAGGSLAQYLKDRRPTPAEAAELLEKVARAVHHAHEQGIIHRDLKPGNILLADASLAAPSVSDFGLAKCLELSGELTPSGTVLGTPKYMAPELFDGSAKRAAAASDVYSLGTVLYEMLAGRPPFEAKSDFETLLLARESAPASLRKQI